MQRKGIKSKESVQQDQDRNGSEPECKNKRKKQAPKPGGAQKTIVFVLGVLACTTFSACVGWYVGGTWDALSDRVAETQQQMYEACKTGNTQNLKQLISEGGNVNYRYGQFKSGLVEVAVSYGNIDVLSILLAEGANPGPNKGGTTPLHLAGLCRGGSYADSQPLSKTQHCQPMALKLLEAGADPNHALPDTGVRPLHLFADQKAVAVVRMLLEHGADPNAVMSDGSTAMHVVGELSQDTERAAIVDLLMEHGANPALKDQSGARPAVADLVDALVQPPPGSR